MQMAKVYIVGAGPGDAGLITINGLKAIQNADVILYDKLANPELLTNARENAELFFVGKEGGHHYVKQEDTIDLMIEKAQEGKVVTRLKGGDPLVFGRGSEEALALKELDIEFEIIPGISAGIGATAYAGIPLTHRDLVTKCVFVTAHESKGKGTSQVDWQSLAQLKNATLVVYMGVKTISSSVRKLIKFGKNPKTPVAIIRNGTLPQQETWLTTLEELPEYVEKNIKIKPPVIFVIGDTVPMHKELNQSKQLPLQGKRIVATRATDQAQSLYQLLTDEGAEVIPFKVIKTQYSQPESPFALIREDGLDWLLLTSENAVKYFFRSLADERLDTRSLAGTKIACVGFVTANRLKDFGLIADFIPSVHTSKSLAAELSQKFDLKGSRMLRVKGDFKSDPLTRDLLELGAEVVTYETYKTLQDKPDERIINNLLKNGADACLFTSTSTVNNFFDILGNDKANEQLAKSVPLAIGPVTEQALADKGVLNIQVSDKQSIAGMVEKLKEML
jgi:uroporphyrinogen III methyltransferase / synthase